MAPITWHTYKFVLPIKTFTYLSIQHNYEILRFKVLQTMILLLFDIIFNLQVWRHIPKIVFFSQSNLNHKHITPRARVINFTQLLHQQKISVINQSICKMLLDKYIQTTVGTFLKKYYHKFTYAQAIFYIFYLSVNFYVIENSSHALGAVENGHPRASRVKDRGGGPELGFELSHDTLITGTERARCASLRALPPSR